MVNASLAMYRVYPPFGDTESDKRHQEGNVLQNWKTSASRS